MWRYRDSTLTAGALLGVAVAIKLFLFPLGLFFLLTRRIAAVAYGVAVAVGVTAASWLILGLDEFDRYRDTVDKFAGLRADSGYSIIGLVERLGGARPVAYGVAIALAAAAAVACLAMALRGRDRDAFMLAVAASLLVTPIVWLHYFTLLLVPIALASPRLNRLWALPVLFWFGLAADHPQSAVQVALALALVVVIVAAALRTDNPSTIPAAAAT